MMLLSKEILIKLLAIEKTEQLHDIPNQNFEFSNVFIWNRKTIKTEYDKKTEFDIHEKKPIYQFSGNLR